MKCRLIDTGYNNAYMNMAIDEALLRSEMPVLRFYLWQPAALSIGYFQDVSKINKDFCKKNCLDIVRRITGGNAVLHDKELTYSFIIEEKFMPESVIESYRKISKTIISALNIIGIKAQMNTDVKKDQKSAVCFNEPSWFEILANKKKIVGSAQKRINGKLLQHGAILMDIDISKYAGCFNDILDVKDLNKRITSINTELGKKISLIKLKSALKKGFKSELELEFYKDDLTEEEIKLAKKLDKEKYSTDNWKLRI